MSQARHLPAVGIVTALGLFVWAAARYPGGTTQSTATQGFSYADNFISSLFSVTALNGAVNPGRILAILALMLLCASLGFVFARIAASSASRVHAKTIQIAGIGAMVYSLLIATPMHDLMVDIGLAFTLVALLGTTHLLYLERCWPLFAWGVAVIALKLLSATMYYADLGYAQLPLMQKLGLVFGILWLLRVYYVKSVAAPGSRLAAFAVH